ncbi:GFA family protein [Pseudomonas xanthosomatis]|uniref:GFA family protein n=1 Tax=Pseudomonas xanthosomatis TaxID=2842356 RepID=UPI003516E569
MTDFYQGSCLCSAIQYELLTAPKAVTHCHCSQCRKGHGAAFASYGSVPREAMRLVQGADVLRAYSSSEAVLRQFCPCCGSSLFWSRSTGEFSGWVSVALGTLDTPFQPSKHKHAHVDEHRPQATNLACCT